MEYKAELILKLMVNIFVIEYNYGHSFPFNLYDPSPSTATIGMSPTKAKVQNVLLSESDNSTPK